MTSESFSHRPARTTSRLVSPLIAFVFMLGALWVMTTVDPDPRGEMGNGDWYVFAGVFGLLCGVWLLTAAIPPKLTADASGVTWTRYGLLRRSMPWSGVDRVITSAMPCTRDNCDCLTYHVMVLSGNDEIDIESGVTIDEADLRKFAEAIGNAKRRFDLDVEVVDQMGWIVEPARS